MEQSNGRDGREVVTQRTYDAVAAKYAHTRCGKGSWKAELEYLWEYLPKVSKKLKVLDLGCGSARVLQALLDKEIGVREYVGVDYSREMLAEALLWHVKMEHPLHMENLTALTDLESKSAQFSKLVKDFFTRAPETAAYFHRARMQDIDPPTSYFDVVTMAASFHHLLTVEEQETLLELCFHTLKPGGVLWMMDWNLREETAPKNARRSPEKDIWEVTFGEKSSGGAQMRYYKTTSSEEMRRLLLYAGFEILEVADVGNNVVHVAVKPVLFPELPRENVADDQQ